MALQTSVLQLIQRNALIPSGSTVVVGVSGGADSLALLHMLLALQDRLGCQLHAATLDHGLRGQVGADDAAYVEAVCAAWGIPCTREQRNVQDALREHQVGVEAGARIVRYRFLHEVALHVGADCIAVGHHADDQAETMLLHLLRGAGLNGLAGMELNSRMYGKDVRSVELIRPLLYVTRAEIETYCVENNIQPRHDATNDDTDFTRNRIRHEVLPVLRTVNPAVNRALIRLGEIARLEDEYVDTEFQRLVLAHVHSEHPKEPSRNRPNFAYQSKADYLSKVLFRGLHEALMRRYMLHVLYNAEIDATYDLVTRMVQVAWYGEVGARVRLDETRQLRVDYEDIVVEEDSALLVFPPLPVADLEFMLPGFVDLYNEWRIHGMLAPPDIFNARLAIPENAVVRLRVRQPGDRFAPLGLGGHTQKLSEWMIDHKVPQRARDRLPLLTVNGEIAAILRGRQWAISEHYAVKPESDRVIYWLLEHLR